MNDGARNDDGALISRPVANRSGIFFWLLRTLVKVRYSFFFGAVILGMSSRSVASLVVWVVVLFAAVLLHEMGHAMAGRAFRQRPYIELHAMGGVTHGALGDVLKWHQSVIIALAGPGIGFLVGGLVYLSSALVPLSEPYALALARFLFMWVTIAWGAFNLLPLLPLDGGLVLLAILEHRFGFDRGLVLTRMVSCATGIAGLVASLALGQPWAALLCGVFAYDNFQRMRGQPGVALPQ